MALGVKVTWPATNATLPLTALPTAVTVRVSPSMSVSLATRLAAVTTSAVSSAVVRPLSSTAAGGEFTAPISLTLTAAVDDSPPLSAIV